MVQSPRTFHLSASGPYFAFLLLLALVAFWPTYVSLSPAASTVYAHFHAVVAVAWALLLIAQPMLIRSGRLVTHRRLGKISWIVAPLFVISVVLLANDRIKGLEGQAYGIQTYILWLQISSVILFVLSYVPAMIKRKSMVHHARFMICSGLTLVDPVVARLLLWMDSTPDWNYQWLSYGMVYIILLSLIWFERKASSGRGVFPVMLGLFFLFQVPANFSLTSQAWWQDFATWFAALPLT
jgi:hypothetical protein